MKKFAEEHLPRDSALYRLLMSEKDQMEINEFVVKVEVYLKLARDLKKT